MVGTRVLLRTISIGHNTLISFLQTNLSAYPNTMQMKGTEVLTLHQLSIMGEADQAKQSTNT